MKRILVIRGGAIGDFILTLPALRALREAWPNAHLEILGYPHIAELAKNRFYANAVRSIEYGPLSRFFARQAELPDDLAAYFVSFDVILSYLYDPDLIFENNLERCGVRDIVRGPSRIGHTRHASTQLADPLEEFGLEFKEPAARFFPSQEDRRFARDFLHGANLPLVAFHPGSGGERKNWPIEHWIELGNHILGSSAGSILILSGEADQARTDLMARALPPSRVLTAQNLALPRVGALLENATFVGHDSGISHLAAAAGASCVLLFGPTDPMVWAPQGENVQVIHSPTGDLPALEVGEVLEALRHKLQIQAPGAG